MNRSIKLISAVVLGFMISDSEAVQAQQNNYKLAVIQDTVAYVDIRRGDYNLAIGKISALTQTSNDHKFEQAMSLCAANIKVRRYNKAEIACNDAVNLVDQTHGYQHNINRFKAMALSNRAVLLQLKDDSAGAYRDFTAAMSLDSSSLVADNFQHFTQVELSKRFD